MAEESVSWGHRSCGVIPASSTLLQAASYLQLRAHGIRATEICFLGIYSEKVMEVDSTTWGGGAHHHFPIMSRGIYFSKYEFHK